MLCLLLSCNAVGFSQRCLSFQVSFTLQCRFTFTLCSCFCFESSFLCRFLGNAFFVFFLNTLCFYLGVGCVTVELLVHEQGDFVIGFSQLSQANAFLFRFPLFARLQRFGFEGIQPVTDRFPVGVDFLGDFFVLIYKVFAEAVEICFGFGNLQAKRSDSVATFLSRYIRHKRTDLLLNLQQDCFYLIGCSKYRERVLRLDDNQFSRLTHGNSCN
ncbi:hypothetical protein SRABI106_03510 [Rahnella aquatilis]|nr:hypothetical protein SRABI106_03510 [Rahnella aquatilis]